MKGDFSRSTFDPRKHHRSVRMQQGRVQLDADWNEQADLFARRVESEAADLIGGCGGPLHSAGFRIDPNADTFSLSSGHYYVDGILCENEDAVAFAAQPDLPGLTSQNGIQLEALLQQSGPLLGFEAPPDAKGPFFVAYLDVWERHITALEDPSIREVALGGPDTGTREKTVWQVKLFPVPNDTNCLSDLNAWQGLAKAKNCLLKARAEVEKDEKGECVVPATAGYRRLENQLYRIEIHRGGEAGQATFKWSRDNGSVVTRWLDKKDDDLALSVESSGRDSILGFSAGDWVELTDDTRELWGLPGTLVKVARVEGNSLILEDDKPNHANRKLKRSDYPRNPRVRRWNHGDATATEKAGQSLKVEEGAVPVQEGTWIKLEDGVQIYFERLKIERARYRTGDYWYIPARTAGPDAQSGTIEWPKDGGNPRPLLPWGIQHHYCRLAVLKFDPVAHEWALEQDCRRLFPPVTELTSLLYVGGDGQEAVPTDNLLEPLQVRVANGQIPVEGANVRFQVVAGGGTVNGQVTATVATVGPDGTAAGHWTLGLAESQRVEARLLDAADHVVPGQVVVFDASTEHVRLLYVSGDGQEALPNASLPSDLQVRVLNKHAPVVVPASVRFRVLAGGGTVNGQTPEIVVATAGPDAVAKCQWTLGPEESQLVEARLLDANGPVLGQVVVFHANTSIAKNVAYDPSAKCPDLKQASTVQEAIDILCQERDKEPGIRIKGAFLVSPQKELLNDSQVKEQDLTGGIFVACSEDIDASTIRGKPTFLVTLDLPYPLNQADLSLWHLAADSVVGFQPLILNGQANVEGSRVLWKPEDATSRWLKQSIAQILKLTGLKRVLVHLRLLGNFIVTPESKLWLDGDTFGGPDSKIVQIGDGRRGGDFEMWFWLVSEAPGPGFGGIRGTVTDNTGAVIPGAQVTLINLTTNARTTTLTDQAGVYMFPAVSPGKYRVEVVAASFQKALQNLEVQAGQPAGVDVTLVHG